MGRSELRLQKKIIALIRLSGGQARLLKETVVGDPDIIGCLHGFTLAWEVKDGDEYEVQPIQEKRLREWEKAGALIATVRSLEEAEFFIQQIQLANSVGQSPISNRNRVRLLSHHLRQNSLLEDMIFREAEVGKARGSHPPPRRPSRG